MARMFTAARRRSLQRFAELEHKAIGDRADGGVQFHAATAGALSFDEVDMTYGDLVALGDYFSSPDEIAALTSKAGLGKGTIGEVNYALLVSVRGGDEQALMGKKFDATAKATVNERFYKLAAANIGHFPNPHQGDERLDPRTKAAGTDGEPATYRQGHERAIRRALELGKAGKPIGGALAIDAFYSHFLTDAFSAGHLRTPRASIGEFWASKVPDFYPRFVNWLGDTVGAFVSHNGGQLAQAAPRSTVRGRARDAVKDALKTMPAMTFGDVVSGAVHDYDSDRGVLVRIGTKKLRLVGDGHLLDHDGNAQQTLDVAVKAVQSSERDVQRAYELGARGVDFSAAVAELTKEGHGLYLPERLVPVPVPDSELDAKDRSLTWAFETVDDLLADPRMRRALVIFANNKASMFDAIMDDPKIDDVAKQGLQVTVRARLLSSDPNTIVALFREILAAPSG